MKPALQELLRLIAADVVRQLISRQQEGNSQTGLADALNSSSCSPLFERKSMKNTKYGFAKYPAVYGKPMIAVKFPHPFTNGYVIVSCEIDRCGGKVIWPTPEEIKEALIVKCRMENGGV